jgi:hypothetical protein
MHLILCLHAVLLQSRLSLWLCLRYQSFELLFKGNEMDNQIDEEQPLDPVMERVRVKMVRLLGISIGLMLIALLTVLGAVIYKINQPEKDNITENQTNSSQSGLYSAGPILEAISVDLPNGAKISSSNFSGNRMSVDFVLQDGSHQLWIVDLQTGEVISRIEFK